MLAACATAQPNPATGGELKKKDQKLLAEAQSEIGLGRYAGARRLLENLIERNPERAELYYLRSVTHKETGDLKAAISDVRVGMNKEVEVSGVVYKELGNLYRADGQFAEAVTAFEAYAASGYVSRKATRKEAAEQLVSKARVAARLAANPVPFSPQPVPGGINTPEHLEYFPSISIDGERMILTRRVAGRQEDFYLSRKQDDGSWSTAVPLEGVNTNFNEGAQSITADGRYLVFTACDRPDGAGSCDLYYSQMDEMGNWSPAKNIGPEINTRDYEAQPSISADGAFLFFTSRRPGGFGNEDIYVSGRLPNGKWSAPVNLGATVNTKGKEQYPFFAPDGSTLFFTSNEHPGLGGDDLFRSELTPDNAWAEPVNLGYPINTAADETNLFVALGGKMAYFSKGQRNTTTGKIDVDIYQFELPEQLRPAAATYVRAIVTDLKTGQPLNASVRMRPTDQQTPPTSRQTGADGTFLAVLPTGKDYALTVDLPGYVFYAEQFTLAGGDTPEEPFVVDIKLSPIKAGDPVVNDRAEEDGAIAFRNVLFESGSAELLPVSGDELDRLAELLIATPSFRVEIVGHTDDVGPEAANLLLSQQRAAAVKTYLITRGVAPDRISTRGEGERKPIAPNDTEAGRSLNRRTTFRLLE